MARITTASARGDARRDTPLAGLRVLLTRPAGQHVALSRQLRAAGATAVTLPAMSIRANPDRAALRRGLRAAALAPLVVFTSPNAVREALRAQPRWRPSRATAVHAIGAATRRALARHRIVAHAPAVGADSEALLREPAFAAPRGLTVHLITAPGGRALLATQLRARGAVVAFTYVYERVPARWDRRHRDALARLPARHASLWSSADALSAIHARLAAPDWRRIAGGIAIVASARIAQAARAAGMHTVITARSALARDLLAALHDAWPRRARASTRPRRD